MALGLVIGVIAGAALDAPRVLLRRLREPAVTVKLGSPNEATLRGDLVEFERLQAGRPRPPRPVASPESGGRGASAPRAGRRAGTGEGDVPAAPRPPTPEPDSEAELARSRADPAPPELSRAQLLEQIARRVDAPAPVSAASPPALAEEVPGPAVQVVAYSERSAAEALTLRLRRDGFDAYVSRTEVEGEARFRVRVRPGENVDAHAVAARLEAKGFRPWVARE